MRRAGVNGNDLTRMRIVLDARSTKSHGPLQHLEALLLMGVQMRCSDESAGIEHELQAKQLTAALVRRDLKLHVLTALRVINSPHATSSRKTSG
jgi:hypothetical protein